MTGNSASLIPPRYHENAMLMPRELERAAFAALSEVAARFVLATVHGLSSECTSRCGRTRMRLAAARPRP
jgi:hypothetical protein